MELAIPHLRILAYDEAMGFQIIKSLGFVLAFGLALGFQRWRPHRLLAGSWRANGALWAIDAALLGVVCAGCACSVSRWAKDGGFGLLNQGPFSAWVAIPVSVLGMDLTAYFWHRANHLVPFLWRFHQAHHSDPDYTVTTALRFHPGELLLALPVRLAVVVALGVPIGGVIVFELLFAFSNFFEHGNISLPRPFEDRAGRIFVTPALHRRHHGCEARLLETNFGTIFSFWDRWLRTFVESHSGIYVETGLPGIKPGLGARALVTLPARGVYRGRGVNEPTDDSKRVC